MPRKTLATPANFWGQAVTAVVAQPDKELTNFMSPKLLFNDWLNLECKVLKESGDLGRIT